MELNDITGAIVDVAIRIHRELGPGLLESVYETVLAHALEARGLRVERQHPVELSYEKLTFEQGFRIDLLVEGCVIVEVKSIDRLAPVHTRQILTYLRFANLKVGLLLNFGALTMKEGLKRVVLDLPRSVNST
jgi:GxxExxY protein